MERRGGGEGRRGGGEEEGGARRGVGVCGGEREARESGRENRGGA